MANPSSPTQATAEEARRLGAWVMNARLGAGVRLGPRCVIGCEGMGYERAPDGGWVRFPQLGGVLVEDDVHIGAQAVVQRGALGDTVLRRGSRVGPLANVSHNADVGEDVLIAGHAQIGGGARLERGVVVWQAAAIANGVHVGEGAVIGMGARGARRRAGRRSLGRRPGPQARLNRPAAPRRAGRFGGPPRLPAPLVE